MRADKISTSDQVIDIVKSGKHVEGLVKTMGYVLAECRDINGKLKWIDEGYNSITAQFLEYTRDLMWNTGSPGAVDTSKFIGLYTSNYTPANPAAITADTTTWAGLSFTEASMSGYARQAYTVAESGAYGMTNSASKASFTMPGTGGTWDIYGAFMISLLSGGTTAPTDWMYFVKRFTTSPRTLANSDVLEITYNVTYA
jgi:hypothetical protein